MKPRTSIAAAIAAGAISSLAATAMVGAAAAATTFKVVPLVSDQMGTTPYFDPNLVNAWGLAQGGGGPLWVSDNGTNLSTVYDRKTGKPNSLVVNIPLGVPTGIVYVPPNSGFQISENGKSGDSYFLFDTQSGAIEGWTPQVDATNAVIAVNNSSQGAGYTGLALDTKKKLLFAADFNNDQVEVYDNTFTQTGTFTDPNVPKGYAPYNVAVLQGKVYVTFAEGLGRGHGYVDVFSTGGKMLKQLIANGPLLAPWGLTIAPKKFGTFAGNLLVGNLGNGKINAFDVTTGAFISALTKKNGKAIRIDGLWGLNDGPGDAVTFSAGPNFFAHGLVGLIKPVK